ncbi:benzoylformate decarboxylase [Kutzneria buriramensis]|uniref:Benzoylformate decarboxylase n=1 Tax=Kutzneria buriramensis TaxID=1045776 RepID=A0A3E0HGJ6_9PSEU|nr:benzoylformate decarboxylase [Kutzneria buriramensis]REH44878.1 benzoylformate decarboxylase [Kutzneria buriramensis]
MGSVRDVTRDLLRSWGCTTVFGNPGSTELPFLADWPDDFRYVLGLHESSVVAMADGYAQFSGRPAVVNLHSSGGVGHGLGSLVTAFRNRTPLLVIAGQQARSLLNGEPFLGAIDAPEFPRPYVKWSAQPARAADVPAALARALHMATQPPQGPVFVSVPVDDWDQPGVDVPSRPQVTGFAPDRDAVAALAAALDASERPAIVFGASVDADDAVEDAITLAERTNAAVWASPMSSRCSFPEDHPLFAGFLPPADRQLRLTLQAYDRVLVIGAPAFVYHVETPADGPELPPLHLVHDDPTALSWAPAGAGLLSTPGRAIRALNALVAPASRPAPSPRPQAAAPAATVPMTGAYVLAAVRRALPADGVIVEEVPSHRNDLREHLPITARGRGFFTIASGVLGYGLPGAVGVSLAAPERPVIAVVGDGSAMYGIQALWTAAKEHAPVTFVVLDNTQYGALRSMADSAGVAKVPGVDLGGLDFCALAAGMGCRSRLVEHPSELDEALAAAVRSTEPAVLHVRVDPGYSPLY